MRLKKPRSVKRKSKGPIKTKAEFLHNLTERNKRAQAETKLVAHYESKLRLADAIINTDEYRFDSLRGGFNLDALGFEISDDQFEKQFYKEASPRDHYYRLTDKGDGRLGLKREGVAFPINKHTITTHSKHDHILYGLESVHDGNRELIKKAAKLLMNEWNSRCKNERVLWMIVHANAGRVHFHPFTTQIDLPKIPNADRKVVRAAKGLDKLLYKNTRVNIFSHPGNNRDSYAGIPLIAVSRLFNDGLWPKEFAEPALEYIENKTNSDFSPPLDLQLCDELDRFLDDEIDKLRKDTSLKPEIEKAEALHKERVAERVRRHRLDLIATDKAAIDALERELDERKRKRARELQDSGKEISRIEADIRNQEEAIKVATQKLDLSKQALIETEEKRRKADADRLAASKSESRVEKVATEARERIIQLNEQVKQSQRLIETLEQVEGSRMELQNAIQAVHGSQPDAQDSSNENYKQRYDELMEQLLEITTDYRGELKNNLETLDSLQIKLPTPDTKQPKPRDESRPRTYEF